MRIHPTTAIAGAAIIVALAAVAAIDAWSAAIAERPQLWVELNDERNGLKNPAYLDVLPREGETVTILDPPLGSYRVKRVEHVLEVDVVRGPFVPAKTRPAYVIWLDR